MNTVYKPILGSLFRRRGNKYLPATSPEAAPFWFEFKLPGGGKSTRVALHTTDPGEAVLRANAMVWKANQYAEEMFLRGKLTQQTEQMRRDAEVSVPKAFDSPRTVTMASALVQRVKLAGLWDAVKDKYSARSTSLGLYQQQANKFVKYALDKGLVYAEDVTREFSEEYAKWLNERITTCDKHIGNLKRIWEMLFPDSPTNPWKLSIRLQPKEKDHAMNYRVLTFNEVMRVRQAVERLKLDPSPLTVGEQYVTPELLCDIGDALVFSYYYGFRIGSFSAVLWPDFNVAGGTFIHRPPKTSRATLGTDYPILPQVKAIVERRRPKPTGKKNDKPKGDVFEALADMYRHHEQQLNQMLKAIFKLAHVEDSILKGRATWHSLRATFCTRLTENGCPAAIVKELAQHTKGDVTQRYIHISMEQKLHWLSTLKVLGNVDLNAEYETEKELPDAVTGFAGE